VQASVVVAQLGLGLEFLSPQVRQELTPVSLQPPSNSLLRHLPGLPTLPRTRASP